MVKELKATIPFSHTAGVDNPRHQKARVEVLGHDMYLCHMYVFMKFHPSIPESKGTTGRSNKYM